MVDPHRYRTADVLDSFMATCPRPTPAQLQAWVDAHPDHADAIRALASTLIEVSLLSPGGPGDPPSEEELEREFALAADEAGLAAAPTLQELVDDSGVDLPTIAERMDIGVDVIAALEEGTVLAPVPLRLIEGLAKAVARSIRAIARAIEESRDRPAASMAAKMDQETVIVPRTWREIVLASHMPDDRKAYWLEGI